MRRVNFSLKPNDLNNVNKYIARGDGPKALNSKWTAC